MVVRALLVVMLIAGTALVPDAVGQGKKLKMNTTNRSTTGTNWV